MIFTGLLNSVGGVSGVSLWVRGWRRSNFGVGGVGSVFLKILASVACVEWFEFLAWVVWVKKEWCESKKRHRFKCLAIQSYSIEDTVSFFYRI